MYAGEDAEAKGRMCRRFSWGKRIDLGIRKGKIMFSGTLGEVRLFLPSCQQDGMGNARICLSNPSSGVGMPDNRREFLKLSTLLDIR